jgi:hypothetical protein
MRLRRFAIVPFFAIFANGCMTDEMGRDIFKDPFKSERAFDPNSAPSPSSTAATRLHTVGSEVVAKNQSSIGMKPVFFAIGFPEPMVFHQGSSEIIVSEGLIDRCTTEAELAAVISNELAKMVASREEKGGPGTAPRNTELPPAPRLTSDVAGSSNAPDMTRLAEEAYASKPPVPRNRGPRPVPTSLARNYLTTAGFDADELTRMGDLIKQAEDNADKREVMRRR